MKSEIVNSLSNILLVSSCISTRQIISNVLLENYEKPFLTTNSIEDGLKVFQDGESIDLIILHISSEITEKSFSFIKHIQKLNPQSQFFAVLSNCNEELIIDTVNTGIAKILTVPVDPLKFLADLQDISFKIAQAKLFSCYRYLYEDPLTKLPNKAKLIKDVETDHYYTLIIINVDYFREVNESYGTAAGDFISQEIAKILGSFIIGSALKLYKLQIDEYAVLIDYMIKRFDYTFIIKKIRHELTSKPFEYNNQNIYINVSIGIASSDYDNRTLVRNAGVALSYAKKNYSSFAIYNDALENKSNNSLMWLSKFQYAFNNDKILLNFQPIICNDTKKIEKFEVLVRLQDEDGTVHLPFEFLCFAKQLKIYNKITKTVIEKSVEVIKKYNCRLSVNLSFDDIANNKTREYILEKLRNERQILNKLSFEMTESESISNYNQLADFINEVTRYKCDVLIDDFGSGYSNYIGLLKLNIKYLKIDGSVIKNIVTDKYAKAVLKSIVKLTKELGIKTIAEFVSDEKIFEAVKASGIDYSQGYYFSKPIDESRLKEVLEEDEKGQVFSN